MLRGVPDLISQALDKLVSNAVDFHRPGSAVEIACQRRAGGVALSVRNEGPPLPEQMPPLWTMSPVWRARSKVCRSISAATSRAP